MDLHELTYAQIADGLSSGAFSCRELAVSFLDRIEVAEPRVAAFLALRDRSDVLAEADAADAARAGGAPAGRLHGVPVAVKDNLATEGLPTTCGSRMLEGFVPPYDATAVARLRAAGAIVLGKTNLDEFAMGSSTEASAFVATRNPWDPDRVPGGSSGGSAAAVAACEVPLALGSDTGGSVRQPAGFCGVFGMKPSYGRVSRYGLVAFASSLDQIGVISRDVEGAAALLGVIAGEDPRDSTTADEPVPDLFSDARADLSGVRVGVPDEYFAAGLTSDVEARVRESFEVLRSLGASIEPVSIPHTEYGVATYYLVADAEASSNLARYDGVEYGQRAEGAGFSDLYAATRSRGFGAEVKRRIMLGTYALSAGYFEQYYLKAQQVRTLIVDDFARAFERVDVIAAPTSPTTAFRLGERIDDPVSMYLADVCTVPASLAGIPAASIPCGLDDGGLPVGLQLMADAFRERAIFRVARAYERAVGPFAAAPGPGGRPTPEPGRSVDTGAGG